MDFRDQREGRLVAGMPAYEPDRQCSERIRARCHEVLLSKQKKAVTVGAFSRRLAWEYAAVAVVCAGYVLEVARRAAAVYGF